jgi:AraC-like DNA-binding protein/uncharacterized cupin superfamily protein
MINKIGLPQLSNSQIGTDVVRLEKDISGVSRYHSHEFIEVAYCAGGKGVQIIEGQEYQIRAGDVFIFNAGVYHKIFKKGEGLVLINAMFVPSRLFQIGATNFIAEYIEKVLGDVEGAKNHTERFLHTSNSHKGDYGQTFVSLLEEFTLRRKYHQEIIENEFKSLIFKVFRDYLEESSSVITEDQKKVIDRVVNMIETNICSINKVDDVMAQVGYNKIYFNRVFVSYVGMSISKLIKTKKIDYACMLLTNTNYTIEQICECIGYSDLKNFYKLFENMKKCTPGEYRNKNVQIVR